MTGFQLVGDVVGCDVRFRVSGKPVTQGSLVSFPLISRDWADGVLRELGALRDTHERRRASGWTEAAPDYAAAIIAAARRLRVITKHSDDALEPWRNRVRGAAARAWGARPPYDGPVAIELTFHLPAPKSVRCLIPRTRPDGDKLERAVLDSLTGVIYADDGQVADCVRRKRWAQAEGPGVDVWVKSM